MLKRFSRRVSLWLYGTSLCTPAAAVWLTFGTLAVLLMASAEGLAWGYVGYFLTSESMSIVGTLAAGLAAFVLVWILDTSLLTFDVTQHAVGKGRRTTLVGIAVRAAMVVGSLVIAAPFVTQLVFRRDVDAAISRRNAASISQLREQTAARHDAIVKRLADRENGIEYAIIVEAAGQGPSRRFGRGPTVATMENALAAVRAEKAAALDAKRRELAALDRDPAAYARRAGVPLVGQGLAARTRAMQEVAQQPGYDVTNRAVKAFLAGLFLAIVVLKVFQPSSVRLYLSQLYQDAHEAYRRGTFDRELRETDRAATSSGMTPLRFKEWYDDHAKQEDAARHESHLQTVMRMHAAETDRLRVIETETRADMQPLLDDIDAALQAVGELEEEMARTEAELGAVDQEIAAHEESLVHLDQAIAYPRAVGAGNYVHVLDTRSAWQNGLASLRERRRLLSVQHTNLGRRIAVRKEAVKMIGASMTAKANTLTDVDEHMAGLRKRLVDAIAEGDATATA